MNKEKIVLVRVTPDFKDEIKVVADKLGLSVSAYIRFILKKELSNG